MSEFISILNKSLYEVQDSDDSVVMVGDEPNEIVAISTRSLEETELEKITVNFSFENLIEKFDHCRDFTLQTLRFAVK